MAVSVVAGIWQYGRHVERADALRLYEAASRLPTADLNDLSVPGDATLADAATWRRVEIVGSFTPQPPTPLRNRPVASTPAYQYLGWFEPVDGGALLVNAGWDAVPASGGSPVLPDLPRHQVTITVILRELEPDDGRRDSGATRVALTHVPSPPSTPYPAYGMLRDSCDDDGPCVSALALRNVPLPSLSTGPHLSYAWQWWLFAALAPVGATVLLRRDEVDTGDTPARPAPPRRRRGASDEEIEDAL